MADKSKIEWTDASWNPIRARDLISHKVGWHCEHATTGCEHCYAEGMNKRLGTGLPFKPGLRAQIQLFLDEQTLTQPPRWKKPRMIFVCSMTDLFADFVPDEWIDRVFAVMALTPQHTYQVLTKRAQRMRYYMSQYRGGHWMDQMRAISPPPHGRGILLSTENGVLRNTWLGVSTERQQEANERVPLLLDTPAAVRFVSAEPLLDELDLKSLWVSERKEWFNALEGFAENCAARRKIGKLDWVIVGGESGPKARPMHPDWVRSLHDQCKITGTAFFFKQWGEHVPIPLRDNHRIDRGRFYLNGRGFPFHQVEGYALVRVGKKAAGRLLDGVEHNAMPELAR